MKKFVLAIGVSVITCLVLRWFSNKVINIPEMLIGWWSCISYMAVMNWE